jgi:hypothetical protein
MCTLFSEFSIGDEFRLLLAECPCGGKLESRNLGEHRELLKKGGVTLYSLAQLESRGDHGLLGIQRRRDPGGGFEEMATTRLGK